MEDKKYYTDWLNKRCFRIHEMAEEFDWGKFWEGVDATISSPSEREWFRNFEKCCPIITCLGDKVEFGESIGKGLMINGYQWNNVNKQYKNWVKK